MDFISNQEVTDDYLRQMATKSTEKEAANIY